MVAPPAPLRVAVLASHGGSNMRALHRRAGQPESAFEVVLVVSNNSQSGAAIYAKESGIAFHHVSAVTHPDDQERDAAMAQALTDLDVDLLVTAGYMKKVGPRTLDAFAGRAINVHPALLPRFGGQGMWGRHVHEAVLAAGVDVTGVTVHQVTDGYDEGPIIDSVTVSVEPGDTVDTLAARVLQAEHALLPEVVQRLALERRA